MTGAGEHVDRLPDPDPLGVLVLPVDAALSTPDVYREADRLGLTRATPSWPSSTRSSAPTRAHVHNDLQDAARSLCPRDRRRARRRARRGRRPRARLRLRPDRRRAVRRRGRPGPRAPQAAARVRLAAARRAPAEPVGRGLGGAVRRLMHPFPLAGAVGLAIFLVVRRRTARPRRRSRSASLVVVGARPLGLRGRRAAEPHEADRGRRHSASASGPTCSSARSRSSRPARSSGSSRPGETAILIGGVVAGQGQISIYVLIGLVWACAVAGDLTSYTLGRRLGRGFLERHGPRLKITEERLRYVEDFFDRRGGIDDPDRALHRARARDRAVHRRRVADGAAQVPPLRRARRGPVVGAVLPARLLLLAVARHGRGLHRPRRRRVHRPRRGRARRSGSRSGSAATRSSARRSSSGSTRSPMWQRVRGPLIFAADHAHVRRSSSTTLLALAAVGTYVFFGLASLLGPEPLAPLDRRRVRRRRRALHAGAGSTSSASLTHVGSLPVTAAVVHRHRDLGRAPRAAPREGVALVVAPRAHLRRRPHRQGRDRPRRAPPASTPTPRGSPIPPATPPTRSPTSRARSCSPAAATTGRPASRSSPSRSRSPPRVGASPRLPARALPLRRASAASRSRTAIYALVRRRRARHRGGA